MDLEKLEELLDLMHRKGVLTVKHGEIEVQLDPRTVGALAPLVEEPVKLESSQVVVTADQPKPSRLPPLLRNKSLGLDFEV